ncbi:hypothetical protein [Tahibacter amnicola]|uniref:Sel1 repeat-containing protein n=1 Tax=Tahibacter amnicola TaxID=2976241 RepID=A0ABY6BIV4_9GAMM|nr:hypothetical protein [Tahibacter amnicola]UXI69427.1 hypothetical protein N4264_07195 [Tahibacter amnicola]
MPKNILLVSITVAALALGFLAGRSDLADLNGVDAKAPGGTASTGRDRSDKPDTQATAELPQKVTKSAPGVAPKGMRLVGGAYPNAFEYGDQTQAPTGPVEDAWTRLEPLARAGDPDAALQLHAALYRCLNAADSANMIESVNDAVLASIEQDLRDCKGVDKQKIATAFDWLLRAANAGSIEAAIRYAYIGDESLGSKAEMIANPEATIRYRENALRLLQSSAAQGSVEALSMLSDEYRSGGLVKQNPVLAYAYKYAQSLVSLPNAAREEILANLGQGLSTSEIELARDKGRQIAERCCR